MFYKRNYTSRLYTSNGNKIKLTIMIIIKDLNGKILIPVANIYVSVKPTLSHN